LIMRYSPVYWLSLQSADSTPSRVHSFYNSNLKSTHRQYSISLQPKSQGTNRVQGSLESMAG
jgi:hypothetical protein